MKVEILIPDHTKDEVLVTFVTRAENNKDMAVTVPMKKKEFIEYVHGLDSTP